MYSTRLRQRITIQEQVEDIDSDGLRSVVWVDFLSRVPAEVLTGPGRESIQSGSKFAETTARITIRMVEGVNPKMRILWQGKVYNILDISNDEHATREIRMRCSDGLNDGQ